MLKGIIFDMDGVIVDTEYFDFQLQKNFILQYNPSVNIENPDLLELVGKSYQDLYQSLSRFIGEKLSIEQIPSLFTDFSHQCYQELDYLPLFRKDMVEILKFAKDKGLQLAVASSSTLAHIEEVLQACGIRHYFDIVMSGESLKRSKPDPEIYTQTVFQLGLEPSECVTIEDSTYGISAGKQAGLRVIAYEEKRLMIDQSQANFIGKDMLDILEILKTQI